MDDFFLKRDTDGQRVAKGALYRVSFDDCCVAGSFEAVLVEEKTWEEGNDKGTDELVFENGVTLSSLDCVKMDHLFSL